jgi:hypothetical protein
MMPNAAALCITLSSELQSPAGRNNYRARTKVLFKRINLNDFDGAINFER